MSLPDNKYFSFSLKSLGEKKVNLRLISLFLVARDLRDLKTFPFSNRTCLPVYQGCPLTSLPAGRCRWSMTEILWGLWKLNRNQKKVLSCLADYSIGNKVQLRVCREEGVGAETNKHFLCLPGRSQSSLCLYNKNITANLPWAERDSWF